MTFTDLMRIYFKQDFVLMTFQAYVTENDALLLFGRSESPAVEPGYCKYSGSLFALCL